MARILVYCYSNINWEEDIKPDSFIESFCNVLSRMGNTVNCCCCNMFLKYKRDFSKSKILNDVKEYKPDLIISFNNVFPVKGILEVTNCPVVMFLSDSPAYIQNKNLIKQYKERYYFYASSVDQTSAIKEWFPNIADDRVILFGHATDLRAKQTIQDINISFVGSLGNWNKFFERYFQKLYFILKNKYYDFGDMDLQGIKDKFFEMVESFKKDPLQNNLEYKLPHFYVNDDELKQCLIMFITSNIRFGYLHELADLGLKIFSYPICMPDLMLYDYRLFQAYQYRTIATFADAEDIYNRSIISLNLPHAQAKDGFSWRVCDILASNSILLSNRQQDLLNLMKGYADLPTYTSEAEAKELAVKLLKDSSYRKDLILASHSMIEDKCRFEPKMKAMSNVLNIPLDNVTDSNNKVEYLNPYDYISQAKLNIADKKYRKPLKKLYFYKKAADIIDGLSKNYLTDKLNKKATKKYNKAFYRILPPPHMF